MRLAPIGLVLMRREEPIARARPQERQRRADQLAKARFVAQFSHQIGGIDKRHAPPGKVELVEALGKLTAGFQKRLGQAVFRELQQVAQPRQALGLGDRLRRSGRGIGR